MERSCCKRKKRVLKSQIEVEFIALCYEDNVTKESLDNLYQRALNDDKIENILDV